MTQSPADNILNLYQTHADAFDALRGRFFVEKGWLDIFLDALPDNENGPEIVDLGCGTGKPMASYLIEKGCNITGIDGAPAMIDFAKASFPNQNWLVADMRALPELKRFHGVIAWHSFFHLTPEDQRAMFEVFNRLCRAEALLLFTSGTSCGEAIGSFEGEPLYHGSLDSAEYESLLTENGFTVLRHVMEDPTCGKATIWLARKNADG